MSKNQFPSSFQLFKVVSGLHIVFTQCINYMWFPCMVWISLVPRPGTQAARSRYSVLLYCYTPCIARLASFPGPYHFPNLCATKMVRAWETGTTSCGPLPPRTPHFLPRRTFCLCMRCTVRSALLLNFTLSSSYTSTCTYMTSECSMHVKFMVL